MKICVLQSSYLLSDSPLKEDDFLLDIRPHLLEHEVEIADIHKATAVRQVRELVQQGFDLFINLCDGAWDEDRAGIEVVQALERYNVPFTGATSDFYEPTREDMKRVCHNYGIGTPRHYFAMAEADIEEAVQSLRFPMIVKHPNSYSSIGMTRSSRVETPTALRIETTRMIEQFGEALIEEFIDGREFTVLVVENAADTQNPVVFQAMEFLFPQGETFKHYDLKWIEYQDMSCRPCEDAELNERLRAMSQQMFLGLNGAGYGRCDIRMNADGELFMLEINPNCGIFYSPEEAGSADFILLNHPNGYAYFLSLIQKAAFQRQQSKLKNWRLRLDARSTYGMYAATNIAVGELIEPFEEQAHFLVSRTHVEKHWNAQWKTWLGQYGYPITEEVWVMWSNNPRDWKPINHSCNPNAWLDNLNLVARRCIPRGEQITVDYATFYHASMPEFACECGSPDCRRLITGNDATKPFMVNYDQHVSDYVKTRLVSALAEQS